MFKFLRQVSYLDRALQGLHASRAFAAGLVPRPCPTQSVPHPCRRRSGVAVPGLANIAMDGAPGNATIATHSIPRCWRDGAASRDLRARVPAEPTPKTLINKAQGKRFRRSREVPPWGAKPPSTPIAEWLAQTPSGSNGVQVACGRSRSSTVPNAIGPPTRPGGGAIRLLQRGNRRDGWGNPAMPPSRHIESPGMLDSMARPAVIVARRVTAESTPKALNNKAQGERSGVAALVPPWGTKPPSIPTPKWVEQTRSARTAYVSCGRYRTSTVPYRGLQASRVLRQDLGPRPCPTRSARFARLRGRSRTSTVPYAIRPSPVPAVRRCGCSRLANARDGWGARDGMVPATRQSSKIGTFCRFSSTATKTTSASVTSTCSSGSLLRLDTTRTLMVIDVRPMRSAWA